LEITQQACGKQIERLVSGSYTAPKGPNFGREAGKRLSAWMEPWPMARIDTPDPKRAQGTNAKTDTEVPPRHEAGGD